MGLEDVVVERGLTPFILRIVAKYMPKISGNRTYLAVFAVLAGVLAYATGMVDDKQAGEMISGGLKELVVLLVGGLAAAQGFQRMATAKTDKKVDEHRQETAVLQQSVQEQKETVGALLMEIQKLTAKKK